MARILVAWEMGMNMGHVRPLSRLGRRFRQHGHEPVYCLKDCSGVRDIVGPDVEVIQAPGADVNDESSSPVLNYTDILSRQGYSEFTRLEALVSSWRNIFRDNAIDLIVGDHSPTAMLAARIEDLPAAACGIGFLLPPRVYPMPPLQWWKPAPGRVQLKRLEREVLEPVNRLLHKHGCKSLEKVADVLDVPVRALTTVPVLDDYPRRPESEPYYGILQHPGGGHWPAWPAGSGPKVFGYLRAAYPGCNAIIDALGRLGVRALICVPDSTDSLFDNAPPGIMLSREPLDVRRGAEECDFAVSYASIGFVTDILSQGKPLLVAPPFVQHAMVAMRVLKAGAAVPGEPEWTAERYERELRKLMDDPRYTDRARDIAGEIARYPRGEAVAERIANECDALITGSHCSRH